MGNLGPKYLQVTDTILTTTIYHKLYQSVFNQVKANNIDISPYSSYASTSSHQYPVTVTAISAWSTLIGRGRGLGMRRVGSLWHKGQVASMHGALFAFRRVAVAKEGKSPQFFRYKYCEPFPNLEWSSFTGSQSAVNIAHRNHDKIFWPVNCRKKQHSRRP